MKNKFVKEIILMRLLFLPLLFCCLFILSACRVRLTGDQTAVKTESQSFSVPDESETGNLKKTDNDISINLNENIPDGEHTVENPDAVRKEYDENASAEIIGGTDRLIHGEGEGKGEHAENSENDKSVSKIKENAEDTALLTVPVDEAENTGVSEEGKEAESFLEYYTVLLEDRSKSLFECKRQYVYWETTADHVTIHKSAPEHAMILNAGAYDVSARLLPENLQVDDGWVVRKNPGVIIKVVESSVLGSSVRSVLRAETLLSQLVAREGWSGIEAVKQKRVLLLSEELLSEPYLQTAAMLAAAKTAVPDLYEDVDLVKALQELSGEAAGAPAEGIFFYSGN